MGGRFCSRKQEKEGVGNCPTKDEGETFEKHQSVRAVIGKHEKRGITAGRRVKSLPEPKGKREWVELVKLRLKVQGK